MNRLAQYRELRDWACLASQQTGKSVFTQLREIRNLKQLGGECGVSDYYWYKLYDDAYLHGRGKADFLGWRLQSKISLALNPRSAVLPAWDKTVFMLTASAAGLPVAPVLACFHQAFQISENLGLHLRSLEQAGSFLRNTSIYPLFGKPAYSQQGYGAAYLAGYDESTDSLILLNGKSISVNEFLTRLQQTVDIRYHKPECGYIFQSLLTVAPEILEFTQWPALCGVRIVCLNGPEGVRPIRAVWKVATAPNHLDNFSLGKNGNFLADIDLVTGEVSRMIGGLWPDTFIIEKHPTTGHLAKGFKLPGWSQVLDICQRAGAAFPLLKIHHWDFALTNQGPMLLELNDVGATEFLQVHGHGLLTLETREFLKRYGNVNAHPWIDKI